jgi:probable rRNA maturation factor
VNCEITVQNLHPDCSIDSAIWAAWFETWLSQPDLDLPTASNYELSLRLTNDAEIQLLNSQYRQKDQPTDVLAFAALENDMPLIPGLPVYLGDIIISVDTANRQALAYQYSLHQELAWLASHGFLHLLGWDHPDEASLENMLQRQEQLLGTITLGSSTIAIKP